MKIIDSILKQNIKGIIFDLDGTLINTLHHHVEAFEKSFNDLNYDIDRRIIEHNMGRTPWDIPRDILFNKEIDDLSDKEIKIINKIATIKMDYYHQTLEGKIPLQDGTNKILSYLKNKKIKMAVCSSTPRINVLSILNKVNIFHYFDEIITGDDVKVGKPNPKAYLLAVKKLGLKNDECFLIGDSVHDIQAGINGNIKSIAVCTGFHSKEELLGKNPDLIINNLIELFNDM